MRAWPRHPAELVTTTLLAHAPNSSQESRERCRINKQSTEKQTAENDELRAGE